MIDDLKPYPAMKDSGVPWLGEVPEHWDVLPNRVLFGEVKERDHPEEPMLSVTITKGVIRQRALLADSSKKDSSNQDKSAYKLVRLGDIAYNKMRAWQGAIGVSDYQGIVSPAYVVERPRKGASSHYLHHLLRTPAFAKEAERWSYGITSDMWSLRPEHFKMIYGCLPPLPEQAAIVRFLDHANRRIRRYIRAKQKLITLLEEQKQAIIHQAVTGQVDVCTGQPYPAYKPSGVEWLGKVPEHWEVRRLKYAVSFTGGGTPSKATATFWSGHIPWVSPKDMTRAQLNDTVDHITNDAVAASATRIVEPGAVLIVVRSGILRRTIPVAINTVPMALNQDMKALRPKDGIAKSEYLLVLIQGNESLLLREWTKHGATVESIEHGFLANSRVPLPPLPEQADIVRYLDKATAAIAIATDRAHRQIDLLREYRTCLIADVVTGKIDVREEEARLPEVDPLADEFDALTTQAAATGMMELEDATETLEEPAMENEATV